uniref:FAD synthase n=1 Tax=Acrobeloides nanus TaxID=290746 RepID=A0A914BYE0_9BILA
MRKRTTAGIIVIGDEILKGSTNDTNSHFICKRLHNRGIDVKKITVVGDGVNEIADDVREFSNKYDIVFTTGGIGPTHDDRTFMGLAAAFDEELAVSKELKDVVIHYLKKAKFEEQEETIDKFCKIPKSANLLWGQVAKDKKYKNYPSIQIKNVISFPGVPKYCEQAFDQLEETLFPLKEHAPFFSKTLYLKTTEIHIHHNLTLIANKYESEGVTIGSYPVTDNSNYKTKFIVEAPDEEIGRKVIYDLKNAFKEYLTLYDEHSWEDSMKKYQKFRKNQPPEFASKLDDAMEILNKTFNEYPLEKIAISFNGGKDCTMLLHLVRVKLDEKFGPGTQIQGFHIICGDEFEELHSFILDVSKKYNIRMREVTGPMKSGLCQLKEEMPEITAVLMGCRSTDPRGAYMTGPCQWTDAEWPSFYRVCPLFDWTYSDIWKGLRGLSVPYCYLYDQGYTSLGDRAKTKPNPALRIPGKKEKYKPAYMLEEENLEREGRNEKVAQLNGTVTNGGIHKI